MALTFTTGMTLISAADAVTNWAAVRISGSGGAPAATLDTVTFKQGSGSISSRVSGANWDSGLFFDYYTANGNTTLNLTTAGNEVLSIWMLCTSPSAILALQNGGAWIAVSSSADTGATVPTAYRRWYVSGADVYPGGWVLIQIDTRKTASVADVGSPNLAAVRRLGVGLKIVASPPTLRSDNLYVDAMWYGRPIYGVKGDGSTVATWGDFLTNSVTNANGLIQDLGGVYQIACGIRFGDAAQAAATTFADATGTQILFKRQTYYYSGVVDALNYADYYLVEAVGAVGAKTSVTLGSVVGTGDARQGVLGGGFRNPDTANMTWKLDFQTDIADLSAARLYGVDIIGAKGGVLLNNDAGATVCNMISCNLVNCGELDPGATGNGANVLACSVIDPLGGTAANRGLRLRATHNVKKVNLITSGTPATQHLLHLPDAGTYSEVMNALIWFGDYSSANLWHGELSNAAQAIVTAAMSNGSNPTSAEFHKTGHASSSLSAVISVTLSLTGLQGSSEVRIYAHGTTTELAGTESSGGTFDYAYSYAAGTYVDIVVFHLSYQPVRLDNYLLPAASAEVPIQQVKDRQYANP